MIEQVMFFVLGALTAALLTIALLPALWRRAVRLTRARLEATLPLTSGEIAAEKDQLRAAHSVDIRRVESQLDTVEAALQAAKADIGARITVIQAHEATIASQATSIEALRKDGEEKRAEIATLDHRVATLEQERDNLATNLSASRMSNQALDQDALNLRQTADQRQARIAELEAQAESLSARLADSVNVSTRLQDEIQTKNDELRLAARKLREAASHIATTERRAIAAETLSADRQQTIEDLQAERLQLIEDGGRLTRERDQFSTNLDASQMARQTLEQDMAGLRQMLEQKQTQISALETQATALTARISDAERQQTRLSDELAVRHDEAEIAAHKLREALGKIASLGHQAKLAETMAADHKRALENIQGERLDLIEENGRLTRERDREHIERQSLSTQIGSLNRQYAELGSEVPDSSQDVVRDLTRTVDSLRRDKRHAESELSALRLEKTAVDAEILRLRRLLPAPDGRPEPPPRHERNKPRPETTGQG